MRLNELEYELNIRGVFGLSVNHRLKCSKLSEELKSEESGQKNRPTASHIPPIEDIDECTKICHDIVHAFDGSIEPHDLRALRSRMIHLVDRVNRIVPTDEEGQERRLALKGEAAAVKSKVREEIEKIRDLYGRLHTKAYRRSRHLRGQQNRSHVFRWVEDEED